MTPAARRRLAPLGLVLLALATLVSFAPLLGILVSSAVADAFGCRLDEGGAHACLVFDVDVGGLLYTLTVLGWLMLVTWPGMVVATVLWLAVAVLAIRARAMRRA